MNLVLISSDGSTRLSIDSFPFTLGREVLVSAAAPNAEPESLAQLKHVSKSHAIFTSADDKIHVADAGSMNGTFLNGRKLDEEKAGLLPGDLLSLAGKIDFMVDLSPCSRSRVSEPPSLLSKEKGTAQLLLDRTPLHCDRDLQELSEASSTPPTFALSVSDDKVFIAPLAPDHGATVDGEMIPPGHTPLTPGTALSTHSGNVFTITHSTRHVAGDAADAEEDRTIYMSDATTFMNVFEKDQYVEGQETQGSTTQGEAGKQGTGADRFFTGKKAVRFIALAAAAVLVIGGIFLWYRNTAPYKAQKLFEAEDYAQCLKMVDHLLADTSSKKLADLGRRSLVTVVTPVFMDSLTADGTYGYTQIQAYRSFSANIPGADKIIETLAFVSRVKRFAELDEAHLISDYEQWKNETIAINAKWTESGSNYKTSIDEISQIEPGLKEIFETFFSDVNDCRENEIYSIKKVSELENRVRPLLQKKDYEAASRLLADFSSPHATLLNTDKWAGDLERYRSMADDYEKADLFNLDTIRDGYIPKSPLFESFTEEFRKTELPDAKTDVLIARSEDQWRRGAVEKAMAILQQIPASPVQEKVEEKIAYFENIRNHQARLPAENEHARCRTIAILTGLLEKEETQLKEQYRQSYNSCRAKAEQLIPAHSKKAVRTFRQFIDNGGISGKMRMEQEVTPTFRTQAGLLADALGESTFSQQLADIFAIPIEVEIRTLFSEIAREQKSQTARIAESAILPSTVIREKLSLLEKQEVDEWLE